MLAASHATSNDASGLGPPALSRQPYTSQSAIAYRLANDGTLEMVLGLSGARTGLTALSRDGGKTWSERALRGLPLGEVTSMVSTVRVNESLVGKTGAYGVLYATVLGHGVYALPAGEYTWKPTAGFFAPRPSFFADVSGAGYGAALGGEGELTLPLAKSGAAVTATHASLQRVLLDDVVLPALWSLPDAMPNGGALPVLDSAAASRLEPLVKGLPPVHEGTTPAALSSPLNTAVRKTERLSALFLYRLQLQLRLCGSHRRRDQATAPWGTVITTATRQLAIVFGACLVCCTSPSPELAGDVDGAVSALDADTDGAAAGDSAETEGSESSNEEKTDALHDLSETTWGDTRSPQLDATETAADAPVADTGSTADTTALQDVDLDAAEPPDAQPDVPNDAVSPSPDVADTELELPTPEPDTIAEFDAEDIEGNSPDTNTGEQLCPEWAGAFSPAYSHDPCEDLLISPEKFQELLPVPVQCPMPFSEIVEPDATFDIWPEAELYWWDPFEGSYWTHSGEIYDMLALEGGGVWVAYRLAEYDTFDVTDPPSSSWQDVRFRLLGNDAQGEAVVDFASPKSLESSKWAMASPTGKPWFAVYSATFFQTEFGLDEQNNIVELSPNGMVPVYSFPKGSGLKPPDGYPISGGYFLPDGYVGQAPATEADFEQSVCHNVVIYRRDLDWNITWKTAFGISGSDGFKTPGIWAGVPLKVDGCGYVMFGNLEGQPTSDTIPPSSVFRIPSFHFFTESGTHVGTRSFLAGYWGSGDTLGATDGKEVVTARSIEGTIQNPTTWSYTVGVLRLKPDGSLKWFSVMWEPDAIFTSLNANSIIALPSGLTIVAADINNFFVKVFVLDPSGCALAVYAFSGGVPGQPTGTPKGTYPANFLHMQRLSDGRFVAHDNHRVFFFSLPAVEEWEAALPPAP